MKPDYSTLDSALEIVLRHGPELPNGFTSHGPMSTEAMCAMGRSDAVMPWIENYTRRMTERPRPSERIDPVRWRDALGLGSRFADWVVFFRRRIGRKPLARSRAQMGRVARSWSGGRGHPRNNPDRARGSRHERRGHLDATARTG